MSLITQMIKVGKTQTTLYAGTTIFSLTNNAYVPSVGYQLSLQPTVWSFLRQYTAVEPTTAVGSELNI